MPRSSGGGSHSGGYSSSSGSSRSYSSGGGSHSGGYSSSSSYSSSSYSSSGYSGSSYGSSYSGSGRKTRSKPEAKVSKTDFKGARKYVYYKNNQPKYYYSDYETFTVQKRRRLIFWIPFLILILLGLYSVLQPSALSMDYDTEIYISDTLGVIDDVDALTSALEGFRDSTGITPGIITVSNETWGKHYANLYAFAFDTYINSFGDEKHWLIAYSQPESPDEEFVDWYWEGVQGDETVYILNEKAADDFGITLQKYLTNDRYSVGEAFTMAFNKASPEIMENASMDSDALLGAGIILILFLWIAIKRTQILVKSPERPKTIPAGATAVRRSTKEITCEYCGGVYLSDRFNCPHCGAGRQAVK